MQRVHVTPVRLGGADVHVLCFCVSRRFLAAGCADGTVRLYSRAATKDTPLRTLAAYTLDGDATAPCEITHVALSPDETRLLCVFTLHVEHAPPVAHVAVLTLDMANGSWVLRGRCQHTTHTSTVTAVAWSADSECAITGDMGGCVCAAACGQLASSPRQHSGFTSGVVVLKEDGAVVQIDVGDDIVVVSTVHRTVLVPLAGVGAMAVAAAAGAHATAPHTTPVGQQMRNGIYGGCISGGWIYASRPRKTFDARVWKVDPASGGVAKTLMFRHVPDADPEEIRVSGVVLHDLNGIYRKVGTHDNRAKYKRCDGCATLYFSTIWVATDAKKERILLRSDGPASQDVSDVTSWSEWVDDPAKAGLLGSPDSPLAARSSTPTAPGFVVSQGVAVHDNVYLASLGIGSGDSFSAATPQQHRTSVLSFLMEMTGVCGGQGRDDRSSAATSSAQSSPHSRGGGHGRQSIASSQPQYDAGSFSPPQTPGAGSARGGEVGEPAEADSSPSPAVPWLVAWGADALFVLDVQTVRVVAVKCLKGLRNVAVADVGDTPVVYTLHEAAKEGARDMGPPATFLSLAWLSDEMEADAAPPQYGDMEMLAAVPAKVGVDVPTGEVPRGMLKPSDSVDDMVIAPPPPEDCLSTPSQIVSFPEFFSREPTPARMLESRATPDPPEVSLSPQDRIADRAALAATTEPPPAAVERRSSPSPDAAARSEAARDGSSTISPLPVQSVEVPATADEAADAGASPASRAAASVGSGPASRPATPLAQGAEEAALLSADVPPPTAAAEAGDEDGGAAGSTAVAADLASAIVSTAVEDAMAAAMGAGDASVKQRDDDTVDVMAPTPDDDASAGPPCDHEGTVTVSPEQADGIVDIIAQAAPHAAALTESPENMDATVDDILNELFDGGQADPVVDVVDATRRPGEADDAVVDDAAEAVAAAGLPEEKVSSPPPAPPRGEGTDGNEATPSPPAEVTAMSAGKDATREDSVDVPPPALSGSDLVASPSLDMVTEVPVMVPPHDPRCAVVGTPPRGVQERGVGEGGAGSARRAIDADGAGGSASRVDASADADTDASPLMSSIAALSPADTVGCDRDAASLASPAGAAVAEVCNLSGDWENLLSAEPVRVPELRGTGVAQLRPPLPQKQQQHQHLSPPPAPAPVATDSNASGSDRETHDDSAGGAAARSPSRDSHEVSHQTTSSVVGSATTPGDGPSGIPCKPQAPAKKGKTVVMQRRRRPRGKTTSVSYTIVDDSEEATPSATPSTPPLEPTAMSMLAPKADAAKPLAPPAAVVPAIDIAAVREAMGAAEGHEASSGTAPAMPTPGAAVAPPPSSPPPPPPTTSDEWWALVMAADADPAAAGKRVTIMHPPPPPPPRAVDHLLRETDRAHVAIRDYRLQRAFEENSSSSDDENDRRDGSNGATASNGAGAAGKVQEGKGGAAGENASSPAAQVRRGAALYGTGATPQRMALLTTVVAWYREVLLPLTGTSALLDLGEGADLTDPASWLAGSLRRPTAVAGTPRPAAKGAADKQPVTKKIGECLEWFFALTGDDTVIGAHAAMVARQRDRDVRAAGGGTTSGDAAAPTTLALLELSETALVKGLHFARSRGCLAGVDLAVVTTAATSLVCGSTGGAGAGTGGTTTPSFTPLVLLLQEQLGTPDGPATRSSPRLPLPRGYLPHTHDAGMRSWIAGMWAWPRALHPQPQGALGTAPRTVAGIDALLLANDAGVLNKLLAEPAAVQPATFIYYLPYLFAMGLEQALQTQKTAVRRFPDVHWHVVRNAVSLGVQEDAHRKLGLAWSGRHEYEDIYLDYCRFLAEAHPRVCRMRSFVMEYLQVIVRAIASTDVAGDTADAEDAGGSTPAKPAAGVSASLSVHPKNANVFCFRRQRLESLLESVLSDSQYAFSPEEVCRCFIAQRYFRGVALLGRVVPDMLPAALTYLLELGQLDELVTYYQACWNSEAQWIRFMRLALLLHNERRTRAPSGDAIDPLSKCAYVMCVVLGAKEAKRLLLEHLGCEVQYQDFYRKLALLEAASVQLVERTVTS